MEDVRSAYLQRAKEYHPDKVATLGDKLKAVAEEEFKAVQTAYEQLRNGRGTATQAAKQAPARDREESTPRERHGQPGHDLPELRFQGLKFGETPQQAHEILKQKWQFEEIDQNGLANYAGQLGGEKVTMQLTFTAITSRLWSVSVFTFFPRGEDLSILSYRMQRLADGISAKHGVGEIIEVGGPSDVLDQFPFEDLVYRSDCQVSRIEWQACNGTINLFLYHPHTGSGNYQPKVILSYNSGEYAVLAADEDEEVLAADLD